MTPSIAEAVALLERIKTRADQGGRRMETAMQACDDIEELAIAALTDLKPLVDGSHVDGLKAENERLAKLVSEKPPAVIEPEIEKLLLELETPTRKDVANGTTVVYTPKPDVLWVCAAYRRLRALSAAPTPSPAGEEMVKGHTKPTGERLSAPDLAHRFVSETYGHPSQDPMARYLRERFTEYIEIDRAMAGEIMFSDEKVLSAAMTLFDACEKHRAALAAMRPAQSDGGE